MTPYYGADKTAGAGNSWSYTTKSGENVRRSEGLAVASLEMYLDGLFSDDTEAPYQVTGKLLFPDLNGADVQRWVFEA